MAEKRKALTEVQAKHLSDTQEALNTARTAVQTAEKNAAQVLTLIFDALGLTPESVVRYDETTKELVVIEEETSGKLAIAG